MMRIHTLRPQLEALNMDMKYLTRNVNEGFSGGEKKRNEILQVRTVPSGRALPLPLPPTSAGSRSTRMPACRRRPLILCAYPPRHCICVRSTRLVLSPLPLS